MKTKTKIITLAILIAGIAGVFTYLTGYRFGFQLAKNAHAKEIAAIEKKIQIQTTTIINLNKQSAMMREGYEKKTTEIIEEHRAKLNITKSKSAAELRKSKASLAIVLQEKEKTEAELQSAEKTIESLTAIQNNLIMAWEKAEAKLNMEWQEKFDLKEEQYQACRKWSAAIEKELKRKTGFWKTVEKIALGTAIGFGASKVL